ncbi:MAG: hypothetical protein HKN58_08220 [Xanthomonadales bacterium]|nr:hypothetical protein [Xanthomonadales bacterium]
MANKSTLIKPVAAAVGVAFVSSLVVSTAVAADNPFDASDLDTGYMLAGSHGGEGSCGEGSCGEGEGSCGEGSCGEGSCGEGSCGEGSCGEGSCGEKGDEGKCGEGKCGGEG